MAASELRSRRRRDDDGASVVGTSSSSSSSSRDRTDMCKVSGSKKCERSSSASQSATATNRTEQAGIDDSGTSALPLLYTL